MLSNNKRILGYDLARALAIIGMIFVNFKTVMLTHESSGFLYHLIEFMSGKAAALFVVLAGIGMTLMYKSAVKNKKIQAIRNVKSTLLKRSLFLFIVGMSYYYIWPADILHFYGVFIAIGVVFLSASRKQLIGTSILVVFIFVILCFYFDYDKGWDWETLDYKGFFTLEGFFRSIFFNGFHPVLPWIAFLFTGIWLGRIDLQNKKIRIKTMKISGLIYFGTELLSVLLVNLVGSITLFDTEEINYLLGTLPMPPLPFYMLSGGSLSVFLIAISVFIAERFSNKIFVRHLISTGKLALTVYFTHVIIGMGGIFMFFGALEFAFQINFVVIYSLLFCLGSVVFSHIWLKYFKRGPLEYLMRKVTS